MNKVFVVREDNKRFSCLGGDFGRVLKRLIGERYGASSGGSLGHFPFLLSLIFIHSNMSL